jgi:hypothetical protein
MYAQEPISAIVKITHELKDGLLVQTIRTVVTRQSHLKYFKQEKYAIGRKCSDWLETVYCGNGEDIIFLKKKEFKNITTIYYTYTPESVLNLEPITRRIDGFKPLQEGCEACSHLARTNRGQDRCLFYTKFLEKHKTYCLDFNEV